MNEEKWIAIYKRKMGKSPAFNELDQFKQFYHGNLSLAMRLNNYGGFDAYIHKRPKKPIEMEI